MENLTYTEINWIINALKQNKRESEILLVNTEINTVTYHLLRLNQKNKTDLIDKLIRIIKSGNKTVRISQ